MWHHKQHTPVHSWNSGKNQFRLAAGGRTSKKEAPGSNRSQPPLWLVYRIIQKLPFCFSFVNSSHHCLTDHTCVCNFMGHTPLIFTRLMVLHSTGSRARDCHQENWHPSIAFEQSNNLLDLRIQQVTDLGFFSITSLVQVESPDYSFQNVILTSICGTDYEM